MKQRLKELLNYYITNRKSGTSTLIRKIAAENDVNILVNSQLVGTRDFGQSFVSFNNLKKELGAPKKPILVDNYAMIEILEGALMEIHTLENQNNWIPVNERLPKIGEYVMIYSSDSGFRSTKEGITKFSKYGFEGDNNVTHWKPLSSPPKN